VEGRGAMDDIHIETRPYKSGVGQGAVEGVFEYRAAVFADIDSMYIYHRGATRTRAGVGVDQGVQ
jgi:hypothetical protein